MTKPEPDTVCALATPPGRGGIAVVRISGPKTFTLLDRIIRGPKPSGRPTHTTRLSWLKDHNGQNIDQVMVSGFRAPKSYTGEDLAEISCHGGRLIADTIVRLLKTQGCRPAEPGEFTRRAVMAGKFTLSQAEAILDLVNARTRAALKNALNRYQGGLSELIAGLAEELRDIVAQAEHHLGFDETNRAWPPKLAAKKKRLVRKLARIIAQSKRTRYLHEGANCAIVGRPNVGKSSLFNRLLGQQRAVVAPGPGTTRDRVDANLVFGDVPVTLSDTGGLTGRLARTIARLAAAQTREAIKQADLILAVLDGSEPARAADREVLKAVRQKQTICVVNKTDKTPRLETGFLNGHRPIRVSALTGLNIGRLRAMITQRFRLGKQDTVANSRHIEILEQCRDAVSRSIDTPDAETAAIELQAGLDILGQVDAPTTSTEILDRVFARFCVGK